MLLEAMTDISTAPGASAERDPASRPNPAKRAPAKRVKTMPPRIKKLIGFAVFLPVLILYFFAAAALGELVPNNQLLKATYFLVAGIAWAFPTKYLITWMNTEPKTANGAKKQDYS